MQTETEERIRVFYREAFARRRLMVTGFVIISLVMLLVGMNWPKSYESSTTILVEEQNIIEPLTRAAALNTVADRAHNARELVFSRGILMQVLEHGGYLEDDPSPQEIEWMLEGMRANTVISAAGRNLIRISHKGDDPEQVYRNTEKMGQLFIEAMMGSKSEESSAAFAFIDSQVVQFEQELQRSEARIEEFRARTPDARPGARAELSERMSVLQARVDDLESRLEEARITETSLQQQLSGEAEGTVISVRAQQLRERIIALEDELDTLRLQYHDTYPDVIALQAQIAELNQQLARVEQGGAAVQVDSGEVRANPIYRDLQSRLYETRATIRTLSSNLERERERLAAVRARAEQLEEVEAQMAALLRDHEVNQSIYEDLKRRREDARVSMNLSAQQQGLNIRVYEEAYYAHNPTGPGTGQFVLGGFALGAVVPLALLFGFLLLDPRVRTASAITDGLELQLLGVVPHMATPAEARKERRGLVWSGLVVVLTVVGVIGFLLLR